MKISNGLLFVFGRVLSPLYGMIMRKREAWYRSGVMESAELEVPVISVGNLTMGGTGKTPLVIHIARQLQKAGLKPAIISRGYKGKARQPVNVVSDGGNILLDADQAGDEPRLMAEALPGVVVITGVQRAAAAAFAVEKFGVEAIVLDDGFQHMALARDLDLVLFKAPDFLGNGRVFPGGDLREPLAALSRAGAFIITGGGKETEKSTAEFRSYLEENFPGKKVFEAGYKFQGLTDKDGEPFAGDISAKKFYCFSGIAQPGGFLRTVNEAGISPYGFKVFKDHHLYNADDLADLAGEAGKYNCDAMLTTEKDMVKIRQLNGVLPVYALQIELELSESLNDLLPLTKESLVSDLKQV